MLRKKRSLYKKLTILFACLIITFPLAIYFGLRAKQTRLELENLASPFGCDSIEELEKLIEMYPSTSEAAYQAKKHKQNAEKTLGRRPCRTCCRRGSSRRDVRQNRLRRILFRHIGIA